MEITAGLAIWLSLASRQPHLHDEDSGRNDFEWPIESLKAVNGFDVLPGKRGKLKAGLRLDPLEFLGEDWVVVSDCVGTFRCRKGVSRDVALRESDGKGQIRIQVHVADAAINDAHQTIFDDLVWRQCLATPIRADQAPLSLDVGDFSYVFKGLDGIDPNNGATLPQLVFSRNNIVVDISRGGEFTGPIPNLIPMARAIDRMILRAPDFEDLRDCKLKPDIKRFVMERGGEVIKVGSRRRARLIVSDAEDKPEQLRVSLETRGAAFVQKPESELNDRRLQNPEEFVVQGIRAGNERLSVVVVNTRLLLSAKEFSIRVGE
ncbi:MAG TPA: hypothetical protein VI643_05940 [Planctomycetota bacterium]|nr:hypothetical protein [Planctomycetota bacterium]